MRPTLHINSRGADVMDWQGIVNVGIDGYFGPLTEMATKEWQSAHELDPDGIVGPISWSAAEMENFEMATIAAVRGIDKLSVADLKALISAANWIGINPDWLAAVIGFETAGSFDPAKRNAAGSGATGLIQFMPSTARTLNTSTEELAAMTFQQQLLYVRKYFEPYRGKLHSLEDTYLVVFYPKEIGRSPDDVIASEGSAIYTQNAGFDTSGKGYITRADVTSAIVSVLKRSANSPRIAVPIVTGVGLLATAAGAYGAYKLYQLKSQVV